MSNTRNWGRISGLGVGVGYVGALAGGYAVRPFMSSPSANHDAFLPTAVLFLLFSLPCFFFVRERRSARAHDKDLPPEARTGLQGKPYPDLSHAARNAQGARPFRLPGCQLLLFRRPEHRHSGHERLLGEGSQVRERPERLAPAIIAAVLGSFLFGFVTDRLTSKQSLVISLLMWMLVFVGAILITDQFIFKWIIAPVAGIALGSTWTAARTMMIELSPRERLGEFLGIYNLTGKYSAVLGPALWGTTLLLLRPQRLWSLRLPGSNRHPPANGHHRLRHTPLHSERAPCAARLSRSSSRNASRSSDFTKILH